MIVRLAGLYEEYCVTMTPLLLVLRDENSMLVVEQTAQEAVEPWPRNGANQVVLSRFVNYLDWVKKKF